MASVHSYSSKEVVSPSMLDGAYALTDGNATNIEDKQATSVDLGAEVHQVYHQLTPDHERLYCPGNSDSEKTVSLEKIRPHLKWTRTRLVVAAVAIILIVTGTVVAGVLVSRQQTTGSHSVPVSNTPSDVRQRSIAAVSFDGVDNSRVYFMTDGGQIVESSQGNQHAGWTVKNTGFAAAQSSRIAAAASRPGQAQEVTVLYMDDSNVMHDIVSDPTGWREGDLAAQNIQPAPSSGLAVMYNWCALCANTTLIAFQDTGGAIHIGNRTAGGWKLTLLNSALNATLGTSLALHPFFRPREPDQINLWTQNAGAGELVLSDWRGRLGNGAGGWNLNTFTFLPLALGASIAAASSYTRTPISGFDTWIQILTSGRSGVSVDTWSGAKNSFLAHQATPAALQYSSSKASQQMYGSLAITAQGDAYAVMSQGSQPDRIVQWRVANDLVTWTAIGDVDMGSEAWT